jgi:tetratricopeptide (TPR) repeat protein
MFTRILTALLLFLLPVLRGARQTTTFTQLAKTTAQTEKSPPHAQTAVTVSAGIPKEELEKEEEIQGILQKGRDAFARKDYKGAIASFQEAVERSTQLAEKRRKGEFQQDALEYVARCQRELGELDAAELTLLRRSDVLIEWGGPSESAVGHNFLSLASLQLQLRKWQNAENYARRAIAAYDRGITQFRKPGTRDEDDFLTANITRSKVSGLYVLGITLAAQGRFAEALRIWGEGYELGERFEAKPGILFQIANDASWLLGQLNQDEGRATWQERVRKLRLQYPDIKP